MMRGIARATLVISIFSVFASCRDYQRYKQLETYRVMSLIAGAVDRTVDRVAREQRRSVARQIIERYAKNGRDAWGNPIRFYERQNAAKYEWVIVSCGSDGLPDVKAEAEYFAMTVKNIHGTPASDIVFRDGMPVTEAGK